MDAENRYKEIGHRFVEIRDELGLNQKEMATELGIQPPSLFALEKGKNRISLDILFKLEEGFKVNPDFLLFGRGPMFYTRETETSELLAKLLEYGKPARDLLKTIVKSRMAFFTVMAAFDSCYLKNKAEIEEQIKEYDSSHADSENDNE